MLQFDEMGKVNKIKIYNKYAKHPILILLKKIFLLQKQIYI